MMNVAPDCDGWHLARNQPLLECLSLDIDTQLIFTAIHSAFTHVFNNLSSDMGILVANILTDNQFKGSFKVSRRLMVKVM